MPQNSDVRLDPRRRHPIIVSPLEPQPEPVNLEALKGELGRRWPMTGLLDILKETDLRVGFTGAFTTAATREATDRDEVQRRLLLCLYGLGTNAGLKRLAVGKQGFSYKELLHTRRRYIDADALRDATRRVVNATLASAPSADLGRGHDGMRLRQQAFRRLRPEPDNRMACPLRRPRRHDLLARRAGIGVHSFATASAARRPKSLV